MSVYNYIVMYVSFLSPLLALILSFFVKNRTQLIKNLQLFLAGGFIFDLVGLILASNKITNYPVANLYFLFSTLTLLYLYHREFETPRKLAWGIAAAYSIFSIINFFFIQGYSVLDSYTLLFSCVIFVGYSLAYFRKLLNDLPVTAIHRLPMLWINISVLQFYTGNVFIFIFNNYLLKAEDVKFHLFTWSMHNILNTTSNILFFVAIWQELRKKN